MVYEADFDAFWQRYPRKVSKLAAKKAYERARKNGARQDELLAGIDAYVQHKPTYADYCHPSTWLNAGRWMDDWTDFGAAPRGSQTDWWEECQRLHGGACGLSQYRHHLEMQKRNLE